MNINMYFNIEYYKRHLIIELLTFKDIKLLSTSHYKTYINIYNYVRGYISLS